MKITAMMPTLSFNPRSPLPGSDARSRPSDKPAPRGFNPRSPLPGSDARHRREQDALDDVSIHAPRCRGAMQRAGRVSSRHRLRFNPRSPLPGSDAASADSGLTMTYCFNPRSPLPGSDAIHDSAVSKALKVSIHAPRCRGAMLRDSATCRPRGWFQSTLPVAGERCPRRGRMV